jgi:6-phosphofructokinase 1
MNDEGREEAYNHLKKMGIEHLVVIGGNGSLKGGYEFSRTGINVIGIPATIDNDIVYTQAIGFDSAVNTALEAINRIRDTATSHGRVFIIEVMGRDCGEIALHAGVAGGAESILIPEIAPDLNQVVDKINRGTERGKLHSIIVVAEGVYPVMNLKEEIEKRTGQDTRVSILGHTQRGGTPSAIDRIMASCMGKAAIDCIIGNQRNVMMAYHEEKIHPIPLAEIVNGNKTPELDMFEIARMLSI